MQPLVTHCVGPSWTYAGDLMRCPRDGRPCAGLAVVPDADLEPLPKAPPWRERLIEFLESIK